MFRENKKKDRTFMIMDGSDKAFVENIIAYVEIMVGDVHWYNKLKWFKHVKCQSLDRDHPTMKVITIRSEYRQFDEIRMFLRKHFSEQCVFDVNMDDVRN